MENAPSPQSAVPKGCGTLIIITLLVVGVVVWKKYFGG
jgi:hypothetical protein